MAAKISKMVYICKKPDTKGFLVLLASNFISKFDNSNWQIQYGNQKFFLYICINHGTRGCLGSLSSNLMSQFDNPKYRIQYDGQK